MRRRPRPLLAKHNGTAIIEADDVERVLTDINADYGRRSLCCRRHGVLLVLAPLASLSLAGQEHGRTIPLADFHSRSAGRFAHSRVDRVRARARRMCQKLVTPEAAMFEYAYQIVGSGPFDLVFVPGFISNVDHDWEGPGYGKSLSRHASFSRLNPVRQARNRLVRPGCPCADPGRKNG
jgi:hypothetical protein